MPVVTSEDLNKRDSLGNAVVFGSWLTDVGDFIVLVSGFGSAVLGEMVFVP